MPKVDIDHLAKCFKVAHNQGITYRNRIHLKVVFCVSDWLLKAIKHRDKK